MTTAAEQVPQQQITVEQIPVQLGSTGRMAIFVLPADLVDSEVIDVGIAAMLAVRSLVEKRGRPRLVIPNGRLP